MGFLKLISVENTLKKKSVLNSAVVLPLKEKIFADNVLQILKF